MSDLDIVEIPGYPGWYTRRLVLQMWQAAGSPPLTSAGRLYWDQKELYDGWTQRRPGYNPADNPDDESQPLAHVRFVGLDVWPAYRAAMEAAGFVFPYDYEQWHAQVPGNVRRFEIVRSIPATAVDNSKPFPSIDSQQEADAMKYLYIISIITADGGEQFWAVNYLMGTAVLLSGKPNAGDRVEFYRNLGWPEHRNQASFVLDGLAKTV